MPAAKRTINHREIRRWVESHGGHPATVKRTRSKDDVGLIRIDFPGFSGARSLEPIEWDEWFAKFDEQGLAFLYQEGKNTNFNKLVRRAANDVDDPGASKSRSKRMPAARGKARARSGRGQSLEQATKAELYERARSAGVPQRSTMSKAELVRALQSL